MVHNITSDIKILDVAKRNLSQSITVLKRLQMLHSALHQLKSLVRTRQYKDMIYYIMAVKQLLSHFQNFIKVKKIQDLSDQMAIIERTLMRQTMEELEGRYIDSIIDLKRRNDDCIL
jgi:hypothetical protein